MEEIKLILESVQTLGGDAKTAFIVWVLCRYLLNSLVTFLLVSGVLYTIYKLLSPLTSQLALISRIKGIMGISHDLYADDKEKILNTLKRGLDG